MQPLVAERPAPPPRDPAPTRMQYRMHRLWLTPVFRALLRVGLPAFVIVLSVGIWFSDEARRTHFMDQIAQIKRDLRDRPEFMVKLMAIDGTKPEIAEAIRELLPVNLPVSSFSLDLEELRQAVVEIDAVDRAELRLAPGGILQVDVTERVPVAIWRIDGRLEMIDATGHRVATLLSRDARPDLPLLAGAGADAAVAEAQSLIAAAQPVMGRVRGLIRVGERRWDIVLDRGQRILLPQDAAVHALERVIALDQAKNVLDRDLTHVDMRNEQRPTIRLAEGAMEDIRRIRGFTTEVEEE